MFDFHLGAKLLISSEKFKEGFFVTGNPGQGKTILLTQIALEAIRNGQSGLLLDPYGDMAKNIKNYIKSPHTKKHVIFVDLTVSQKELNETLGKGLFVIAGGNFLEEGNRQTTKKGIHLLQRFFQQAKKGQWLIVDEAFSILDDGLFQSYLKSGKTGLCTVFSASDFFLLSKEERKDFAKQVKNFVIYKPRHMNAVLMAKERKELNPEDIKAIEQFHFQLLMDGKVSYQQGKYPLADI